MLDFFIKNQDILIYLGIGSFIFFIIMILITPWLVGKIPYDYFVNDKYSMKSASKITKFIVNPIRNIFGFILLILGFIMLFTPGQGIITILLAVLVMRFPYKRELEQKIIANKNILKALNWLRDKNNKPHIIV